MPKKLPPKLSKDYAPILSLVAPMFNEEEVIDHFFEAIEPVLESIGLEYEIVCVDDGSRDRTWEMLLMHQQRNPRIRMVRFSRNFGKEQALTAGLDHAQGRAVIPIDVDLQDPPELIARFVEKWQEGYDVVYGLRVSRTTDTLAKRKTAEWFYTLYNKIAASQIPSNAGDYRLMDRAVVDVLNTMPERNRFMKGLFAWVGFKQIAVEYERAERAAGDSKFNYWKLWNFALDGVTSFSTFPLRVWTYIGAIFALASFAYAGFLIIRTMIQGVDVPGYASIMVVMLFIGGLQMINLGVIGEYLGRMYVETKRRPLYVVSEQVGFEPSSDQ